MYYVVYQYDLSEKLQRSEMNFVLAFGKTTPINGCTLPAAICNNARHFKDVDIILVAAILVMHKITN